MGFISKVLSSSVLKFEKKNKPFSFEPASLIVGDIKVQLSHIGEGYDDEYRQDDPDDEPLLRFTIFKKKHGKFVQLPNCSYCTAISAKSSKQKVDSALKLIMDKVNKALSSGQSIKRLCEELSLLHSDDL